MAGILILEDDEESRKALTAMLLNIKRDFAVEAAATLEGARQLLKEHSFDLFFLDVNLDSNNPEDASGLKFAEEIRGIVRYEMTPIVMLTSVAALEIDAYRRVHCYQYIIKPYEKDEVCRVAQRVLAHVQSGEKPFIIVKKNGINYKLLCEDIVFCKAIPRGVCICLKEEQMEVPYTSIKQLMDKLPGKDFIQCHRMFVVNKSYIRYYDLVNQMVQMEGYQEEIDIGVTYKAELRRRLDE